MPYIFPSSSHGPSGATASTLSWHSTGKLTSEAGVQQGDPLGPFYFTLVLHHLVLTITKDDNRQDLLFNAWFLDDGVVAGPSSSVQHVVHLLQDLGPSLGLHLNPPKCELFSQGDLSLFPSEMNKSCTPNLTILGAPIGDVAFCSSFIASKRAAAQQFNCPLYQTISLSEATIMSSPDHLLFMKDDIMKIIM